MRIEFPFREILTPFGPLSVPTIELPVKTLRGFRGLRFVVDSGADFSMMPRSAAEDVGANLDEAPSLTVAGIEGSDVSALLGQITLKVGHLEITIPCLFSPIESTPLILGRMGFFHRFAVTFDALKKIIVLEGA